MWLARRPWSPACLSVPLIMGPRSVLCLTAVLCEATAGQVCLGTDDEGDRNLLLWLGAPNTSGSSTGRETPLTFLLTR